MSQDPYRELRRYVKAGNKAGIRKVLERMLEQDPEDAIAKSERERLDAGLPLLAERPIAEYNTMVRESLQARLLIIPVQTPESGFGHLSSDKLREMEGRINALRSRIEARGGKCTAEIRRYQRHLRSVLRMRKFRSKRKTFIAIPICALAIAAITGSVYFMKHKAEDVAAALEKALANGQWTQVTTLRHEADSGIYNLLHPAMDDIIYRADTWMAVNQQYYKTASKRLAPLRKGERSVESMSLAERAAMERELRVLPQGLDDLTPIWKQLCDKEKAQLDLHRMEEMGRLQAPLPEFPEWKGEPDADIQALKKVLEETQLRYKDYQDAVLAYHLEEKELEPLQARIKDIRQHMDDLEATQKCLGVFSTTHSAKEYGQAAATLKDITWYAPAVDIWKAGQHLPAKNQLRNAMVNADGLLPESFWEEARTTFLKTGPTFTANNPATSQQLGLLEDLFTSQALRTRLLELVNKEGRYAYTSDTPTQRGKDLICFSRSGLDPAYRVKSRELLTWSTEGLRRHHVDPSPVIAAAGLERRTFYVQVNLPQALTKVLRAEADECPALARAYIYDRLLQVLMAHPDRNLLGVRFSPSLQEDSRTFMNLRDGLGIELTPGCWLAPSESLKNAEAKFQRWFKEHRKHDYAAEIARNYGRIAKIHPRYVGYIAGNGRPRFSHKSPPKVELWYLGQDGSLQHGELPADGEGWQNALPYSPVFEPAKDTAH